MANHRKARTSRYARSVRASLAADLPTDRGQATVERDRDRRPCRAMSGQALEELAEAARAVRRTGWSFGAEVLASADTARVPRSRPADLLPQRYATYQPTAPFPRASARPAPSSRSASSPGGGIEASTLSTRTGIAVGEAMGTDASSRVSNRAWTA